MISIKRQGTVHFSQVFLIVIIQILLILVLEEVIFNETFLFNFTEFCRKKFGVSNRKFDTFVHQDALN